MVPPKNRHRFGLAGKLILAIVVAGTIPIVVGLSVAYVKGNTELQQVIGESFQALAEESASKVDGELQRVIAANRLLAEQAGGDPGLRRMLDTMNDGSGSVSTETGSIDWPSRAQSESEGWTLLESTVSGSGGGLLSDGSGSTDRAPGGRAVVLSGLQLGEKAKRHLFRISTAIMGARAAAPIGWLHREYDVKNLMDPLIYPIRFGQTGHVMLIDNLGAIVSCPLLVTGSRITDESLLHRVAGTKPGWITAENDGHGGRKFSIIGHAPLPGVNRVLPRGVSWHMFVWQDSGEIFAPNRSLLTGVALAGVLSIGLLGILGYFASTRIVRPIRRLRQEAAHIAGGDLNRRLDIRSRDEIEDLAAEFDDMRTQLRQLIGNLEEKVEERTRELRDTQAEKDRVVEQLIQAEKMTAMGTLASGIGHEINNPLYAILGRAEAIRDEANPSRSRGYGEEIIKYAKQIAGTVKDLSGYVRPGSSHDFELVDVNAKLFEAVSMAKRSLLSDDVEVHEDFSPRARILAKPDEIRQAYFNIIRNSIQAMEGKGTLDISTRVENDMVSTRIRDSGPGISEDHQRKIFDPFFTTKGPDEGEGLGLYIVQQIVKKYDGEITLSSHPGEGTEFCIRFPTGEQS